MADTKISNLTGATTPLAGTEVLPIVQGGATVKVASDNLTVKNLRSNATNGILQVAGPAAASTRVMTTPDANFTAARTDAGQTFSGTQLMTGVLGIGTTSPTVSFTVSNSGAYGIEFDVVNQFITSYNRSGSAWARVFYRASDYTFNLSGSNDAFKIDSNANFIVNTAAKGINFTANSPAAGMTSQLLNAYETGTWTPTLAYSVSNGDLAYNSGFRNGYYTKVGTLVTVVMYVLFSETTASGNLTITNLPFATASLTNTLVAGGMYVDGMTLLVGAPVWQINQNGSTVMSFFYTGTGSPSNISNTNTSAANNVIRLVASYYSA